MDISYKEIWIVDVVCGHATNVPVTVNGRDKFEWISFCISVRSAETHSCEEYHEEDTA